MLHNPTPLNIFSALCVGLNHPRLWWRRGWPRLQRQSHAAQDQGWRFTATRTLWSCSISWCHDMSWYMLRYMQWNIMQSAARSLKFGPVGHLMQLMCQPQVGKGPAAASYSTFAARQEQRRLATAFKFLWQFFSKKTRDGWIREEVQTLRINHMFLMIFQGYIHAYSYNHTRYIISMLYLPPYSS